MSELFKGFIEKIKIDIVLELGTNVLSQDLENVNAPIININEHLNNALFHEKQNKIYDH